MVEPTRTNSLLAWILGAVVLVLVGVAALLWIVTSDRFLPHGAPPNASQGIALFRKSDTERATGEFHSRGPTPVPPAVALSIERHPTVPLDDIRAGDIAAYMETYLYNATDGLRCIRPFRAVKPVVPSEPLLSIENETDLDAVLSKHQYPVHVVNSIHWCGKIGDFNGCTQAPWGMAVVRVDSTRGSPREGVLWLHEFGHLRGLGHRDDPRAVMYCYLQPYDQLVAQGGASLLYLSVNQGECNGFRIW